MDVNPSSLIFCVLEVANKQIFILANMHYRASYNVINVGIFSEELRGKPGGAFYNKWRCASRIEKGPKEGCDAEAISESEIQKAVIPNSFSSAASPKKPVVNLLTSLLESIL